MRNSRPSRPLHAAGIVLCAVLFGVGAAPARADAPPVLRFATLSATDAQRRAVDASPDVAAARASVDAAAAAVAQARGVNGFSFVAGFTELPQSGGAPGVTWAQRLGTYEFQATLGDVSAFAPLVMQAAAALRQSIADELTAERTERLKVTGLYFAALQTRAVLIAKRSAIENAEDFENEVRERFDAHKVPRLDLLRAEVSLAHARVDEAQAQGQDANATDALAREAGLRSADLHDAITQTQTTPDIIDDERAIALAFAQRPEIRSADAAVEAARHGIAAAQRAVVPPVTVAAGYVNGVDSGTTIGGPAVSISMQIPLSGAAGARIAAQTAALRIAEAKRDGVRRALALEVGAAVRTASAAIIARTQTQAALESATSYRSFATSAYRSASTGAIMVKDAQEIYDQAVIDDIAADYNVLQAQAILDIELSP